MSYILEALKKAESERQLGAVPNLLAQSTAQSNEGGPRLGLWIIGGLLLLLILLVGALLWRSAPGAPAVPVVAVPGMSAVVSTAAPTVNATVASAISLPISPPVAAAVQPAVPVSTAPLVPPLALATPSPKPVPQSELKANPAPDNTGKPKPGAGMVVASAPMPVSAPPEPIKPADPINNDAADEQLPLMAQLPEAIVREVPQVQVKGYIYSKIPAERTLIVGSNLFHEGDEVVPGVHLEKLLPKAAVMNYRGFRYRVGY